MDADADAGLAGVPGDVGLVQVRATATELRVTVTNDVPSRASLPGSGHGIAGMT